MLFHRIPDKANSKIVANTKGKARTLKLETQYGFGG
jgi:hypothetical protein